MRCEAVHATSLAVVVVAALICLSRKSELEVFSHLFFIILFLLPKEAGADEEEGEEVSES